MKLTSKFMELIRGLKRQRKMIEIVISNGTNGGFDLFPEYVAEFFKRKHINIWWYKLVADYLDDVYWERQDKIGNRPEDDVFYYEMLLSEWIVMPTFANLGKIVKPGEIDPYFINVNNIPRDDEDLVDIVKKAEYQGLTISKLPYDYRYNWTIEEDDYGRETVILHPERIERKEHSYGIIPFPKPY